MKSVNNGLSTILLAFYRRNAVNRSVQGGGCFMRKVLKVSTALILSLVMVFGVSLMAFAASKSDVVEIVKAVDDNGTAVDYELTEVSGIPLLTEKIAAEKIGGGVKPEELTVVWQMNLTAASLPATFTFSLSGVKADQEVYLFHYGGDWEEIDEGKGTTISHKFGTGELSPVGLVVKNKGQNATTTTEGSDIPTGDTNNIAFWGILMVVAAFGAVGTGIYAKKRMSN